MVGMEPYLFTKRSAPLLVSMPHVGTELPEDVRHRLTEKARMLPDTDWHVHRLYDFLAELNVSVIQARYSRYVIDLNRPPDGQVLYPGASNTELCPTSLFDGDPIHAPGGAPDSDEIRSRLEKFWRPYHDRLESELAEIRRRHGMALLFDAHSIRSIVPRFFEGRLPDINLGTGGGGSAAPELAALLIEAAAEAEDYSSVLNGRFKGGYITRRYGRPAENIHAVQLELSQITYMNEDPPFAFRDDLAARVRPRLRAIVAAMLKWGKTRIPGG
jgi:N-formylglutamate deformylase